MQTSSSSDHSEHYFVGLTLQSSAGGLARIRGRDATTLPANQVYPTSERLVDFVGPIMRQLRDDSHVTQILMRPVLGHYGISRELSVGLEVRAATGFNAAELVASVFRQARAAAQTDAFVGRVLPPDEWSDNARPCLTVQFTAPRHISAISDLLRQILSFPGDGWTIDGFTTIPAAEGCIGMIQGLRYLFLPEISIRWDRTLRQKLRARDDEVEVMLLEQATHIGRLCVALQQVPDIAAANLNWFDVIVAGIEDYDDIIARLAVRPQLSSTNLRSMTRKAFSEILNLTSSNVMRSRLLIIEPSEAMQPKHAAHRTSGPLLRELAGKDSRQVKTQR